MSNTTTIQMYKSPYLHDMYNYTYYYDEYHYYTKLIVEHKLPGLVHLEVSNVRAPSERSERFQ